jgi:hypothetical protein
LQAGIKGAKPMTDARITQNSLPDNKRSTSNSPAGEITVDSLNCACGRAVRAGDFEIWIDDRVHVVTTCQGCHRRTQDLAINLETTDLETDEADEN